MTGMLVSRTPEVVEHRHDLAKSIRVRPPRTGRPGSRLPTFIVDAPTPTTQSAAKAHLGGIALAAMLTDHGVLEQVGPHPFLSQGRLAHTLGCSVAEVGSSAGVQRTELTRAGLELAAAHSGLSLAAAVHELGLSGGGSDNSVRFRRVPLGTLAYTGEVDEIFVISHRMAREQRVKGSNDAMKEWQNASACSRRDLRPDGYGICRHVGVSYGSFLKLDRGTMITRAYFKKFAAHYRYGVSGRFRNDYHGYPTIFLVAPSNAVQERVALVARVVATRQPRQLPLLLSSRWRASDPGIPFGLLGPIWREPEAPFDDRRGWILRANVLASGVHEVAHMGKSSRANGYGGVP